jgi:NADH-quinone oxidoreductase subunit L
LGLGLGYSLYRDNKVPRFSLGPLYKLARDKFYVDEIYNYLIIAPLRGISYVLHLVVDEALIDSLLVRGGPRLTKGGAMVLRRVQSGNVQRYAVFIAIGSAVILYLVLR